MQNHREVYDMDAVDAESEQAEEVARRLNKIILTLNVISAIGLMAAFLTHQMTGA
jgi:hypothetical protein